MKKIISGFILISLLSSCVTRRACERRFTDFGANVSTTDSTNTLTVIRDTTMYVKIPGDTTGTSVPLNDLFKLDTAAASGQPTEVSRLNTALATSTIWLKDGRLHHSLAQRDTTVATTLQGVLKTTHKISQKTTQKTSVSRSQKEDTIQQTRYTNQLTGWQWTQVYLGRVFIAALIVIALWTVLKRSLV